MTEEQILETITDELCSQHGCHTVILYGSRARGDASEASDYDIMAVRDSGDAFRDARLWNGAYLDIFVYPKSKLECPDDGMLDMRHGRVLRDHDDTAKTFFARLERRFREGPRKLPADEIAALRTWHQKALDRIRLGGIQGNLRRFELVPALLEHYFTTRGEWYRGPKASFLWLKQNRSELYATFERAFEPAAAVTALEDLVARVDLEIARDAKPASKAAPRSSSTGSAGRRYRVTRPYEIIYQNPIKLKIGDTVVITKRETNPEWLGWVFCVNPHGTGGWVSETYLQIEGGTANVIKDYDAAELAVSEHEVVESLHEEFGWAWVRDRGGREGWVPLLHLELMSMGSQPQLEYVQVPDGKLATFSIGEGPAILFLHGGPGDTHHYMARMAEPLYKDFRCIFFDQRGTGLSDQFARRSESFSIDALLSDLLAIKSHFKLERPALLGHSWGAMYALFACVDKPGEWSRAGLLSMGPLDSEMGEATAQHLESTLSETERSEWRSLRAMRNLARDRGDLTAVQSADRRLMQLRVKAWVFNPDLRATFLAEYFQDPPPDREVHTWIWQNAEPWFSWSALERVEADLWICTGKNDSVPIAQSERIVRQVPGAKLSVLDQCGHMPWLEHPEVFYSLLRSFFSSTTLGPPSSEL